jgi:hypothetical protein
LRLGTIQGRIVAQQMKKKKYTPPGMKMDVTATVKRSVAATLAAAGVIALLLLSWIGGELHYRNCLAEAELRHPVAAQVVDDSAAREEAVSDCSRWPWS